LHFDESFIPRDHGAFLAFDTTTSDMCCSTSFSEKLYGYRRFCNRHIAILDVGIGGQSRFIYDWGDATNSGCGGHWFRYYRPIYACARPNTVLKGAGEDQPTVFDEFDVLLGGSGDSEDEHEEPALSSTWTTVIIIGSVLFFLLICVIIPCVVECRKCRREGHCCCLCCSSDEDDIEDMQAEASSLERQRKKARLAGYDDY